METLYERIERLCREKGIRPGTLCTQLGLSRSLMTDLKMGRKKGISTDTAKKLADFFGISVDRLLDRETPAQAEDILAHVDVAFYGEYKQLSDEDKETVRDMVQLLRQRRAARQRE